jgi:hypothetical protein
MAIGSYTVGSQLVGGGLGSTFLITVALTEPLDTFASYMEVREKVVITVEIVEPAEQSSSVLGLVVLITADIVEPLETTTGITNTSPALNIIIIEPVEDVSIVLNLSISISAAIVEPIDVSQVVFSIVVNKKVLAFNVFNNGLSEYSGYNFDSVFELGGKYYGVIASDGVYLLEGTNDNGTDIESIVQTGVIDYGDSHKKNVPDVFIGCELAGQMQIRSITDEEVWSTPKYVDGVLGEVKNKRVKLSLKPSSRYWGFEIRTVDGAKLNIDTIESEPDTSTRRI